VILTLGATSMRRRDFITGTPPGVALGMNPTPQFLKAGDVVRLGIDGLGEQQQRIVKFKM
jgi:2-keto-4-pentenoate hydratase/2-oxohepta-3-ene-1,7-dioic acid hydratase in catechol pathway